MQIIPGWHPIIVHFAVALTITAAAALVASRLIPQLRISQMLAIVGTWNLGLGTLAALVAIGTGIAAVWDIQLTTAVRAAVSTHIKWAFFTTLALILLSVWRGAGAPADSKPSNLYLIVLSAAVAAVAMTAYLGAENVYRYGVGVLRSGTGP